MLMLGEQLEFNHFATKEIPKYPITKVEGELEDILVGLQSFSERYKVEKKMEVHFRIVRFLNSYEIGNSSESPEISVSRSSEGFEALI